MSTLTTPKGKQLDTVGARIRAERLALKLTQDAFSKRVGVHRRTQVNYESGEREPDTTYLEAASRIGVDIGYVLTGKRANVWHQALIHLVDVMLDLLHLSKHQDEFNAALQIAYDEHLAIWRGEAIQDKADSALWTLLMKSPLVIENSFFAEVIERLEFVIDERKIELTPEAKSDVILRLYQEAKPLGKQPDLKTVAALVDSKR